MTQRQRSSSTGFSDPPSPRVVRHDSDLGFWESTTRQPHPRLSEWIVGPYQGWIEKTKEPMIRREVPAGMIPIILNLGPAFRMLDPNGRGQPKYLGSFVAGLHESFALVQSGDFALCLQVNLSPLGAYRLLGVPMHTLINQTIELEAILGAAARRLTLQLQEAADWEMRFCILDDFITERLDHSQRVSPAVGWAWQRLHETAGLVDISTLSNEIRCSHKHLITQFRREIGLPPKTVARILRFNRAVDAIKSNDVIHWLEIAHRCGYYDQAHLIRDFREFAGSTPGEHLGRMLPDGGGVAG